MVISIGGNRGWQQHRLAEPQLPAPSVSSEKSIQRLSLMWRLGNLVLYFGAVIVGIRTDERLI